MLKMLRDVMFHGSRAPKFCISLPRGLGHKEYGSIGVHFAGHVKVKEWR
jgi:hypothetical protein